MTSAPPTRPLVEALANDLSLMSPECGIEDLLRVAILRGIELCHALPEAAATILREYYTKIAAGLCSIIELEADVLALFEQLLLLT